MRFLNVSNFEKFFSIIIIFSGTVNLKFHTKITSVVTVENRFRLVAVIVNVTAFVAFLIITFMAVVFAVKPVSVVIMNQTVTAVTARVIIAVTVVTK